MNRFVLVLLIILLLFQKSCTPLPFSGEDYSGIDHLHTGSPEAHQFDLLLLKQLEKRIAEGDFGKVTSLIMIHQDELILEKYFHGKSRKEVHGVQSETKSIASLLFGIAVDQGYLQSLDESVADLFSEYDIQNLSEAKKQIQLEHLLTMTAGFQWDE